MALLAGQNGDVFRTLHTRSYEDIHRMSLGDMKMSSGRLWDVILPSGLYVKDFYLLLNVSRSTIVDLPKISPAAMFLLLSGCIFIGTLCLLKN